jgi:UDP-N-acetyl-D-mannosaminuronate dehydrogenase
VPSFSEGGHEYASVPLTEERLRDVDGVLIVTDHTSIDWQLVKRSAKVVVDTRHILARVR